MSRFSRVSRAPATRSLRIAIGSLILGVGIATPSAFAQEDWQPLLNGKDLSNWVTLLAFPHKSDDIPGLARKPDGSYEEPIGLERDPVEVFTQFMTPEGPMLRVTGRIFGTLITRESYSNYHLRLQFKWGERKWAPRADMKRDSGLLYHISRPVNEPGRSFPRALEFQIQETDTGDLYAINMQVETRARLRERQPPLYDPAAEPIIFGLGGTPRRNLCAKLADHERPHGEWNELELFCVGPDSVYIVNGHVVMRARNPRIPAGEGWELFHHGRIALQSEGAEVYFRKVEIRPIAKIPSELTAP